MREIKYHQRLKNLKTDPNKIKTDLVRNFNGYINDNNNLITFETREDADKAITDYFNSLLTLSKLVTNQEISDFEF